MSDLRCRLAVHRKRAGLSVTELAKRVGVSRQALTAVEAGRSVPSTAVALRLAAVLDCSVETLFELQPTALSVAAVSGLGSDRVLAGQVGGRWVAHRLPFGSTERADGLLCGPSAMAPLQELAVLGSRPLVAGCAPILGALHGDAAWVHASSGEALRLLASGMVHVAGLHLAPTSTPAVHDALVRQAVGADAVILSLVSWREGLVLAEGNPLGLDASELGRPGLRIARRPDGAAAGRVLEAVVSEAGGIADGPVLASHVDSASAVAFGAVDVAVAIEPVALALGLHFVPLIEERFELAMRRSTLSEPGVRRLLDRLCAAGFAAEVRAMGAYDTAELGAMREVA